MLKKYLEQQQANLKQMGQRQQQLNQQAANEERRLQLLTEHISGMERSYQMKSALGLQNLASMKTVLQDMQQQQQEKVGAALSELQQQQLVAASQDAVRGTRAARRQGFRFHSSSSAISGRWSDMRAQARPCGTCAETGRRPRTKMRSRCSSGRREG